jgi:hypothetical protein
VRADGIVVFTPGAEHHLRFGDGCEDVAVQAFIAELAVEAFDKGIFNWLAW